MWGQFKTQKNASVTFFAEVFFRFGGIEDGHLKAFIGTVARRKAVDSFRKLSASREEPSEEEVFLNVADETDVENDIEVSERGRLLYETIRALGEPDSTIIIQKYYYDRNSADIARDVGMSPVAVRVRLNRALKRLQKILKE